MEKTYQPNTIEAHWTTQWEEKGYYKPSGNGKPFCIMIPPPNVTGTLHMGHAFQYSLMDALIRYQRMCGSNTLWQVGTDHAGIATQILVERKLEKENKTRQDVGRKAFIERAFEWKEESRQTITSQIRRMGASVDWSRERFTMDPTLSKAVQTVFIQLYREDLIYRGYRLSNWDPKLKTAISDLEVSTTDEKGSMYFIRYPVVNSEEAVIVATTRPETLFGDVAVAVHPDDERYQHLIGKHVQLPLADRTIPVVGDEFVVSEFGSGCVKITPAHDFRDHEVGKRHQLNMINIMNPDATLNQEVPKDYQGLDRFVARQKIIEVLKELELLEKIEPYVNKIARNERSGEIIEPFLTQQWFVKTKMLAEKATEVVASGQIQFIPENWQNTYFQWLNNIEDWCISRQLWWGHQIPAWYDEANNIYVGTDESDIRKHYQLADSIQLKQDEDVLDTWFSSALWPFSTLGWPEETEELKTFYPTQVLVTGFDIIFFWVARMVMMGLKFTQKIPFEKVYITGLVRDQDGQKMSKSKGNIIDPLDLIDGIDLSSLIEKRTANLLNPEQAQKITDATQKQFPQGIPAYGTDALRFTFCALATTGRDIRFDLARVEGYRNFCNKLWNAARFVLMQTENYVYKGEPTESMCADRFIRSRLQALIEITHRHLAQFRFDLLAQAFYEFTWNEYCDWYLELAKITLNRTNDEDTRYAVHTCLLEILEKLLRLMHPFIPFITEEIWQAVKTKLNMSGESIMQQPFPDPDSTKIDEAAETTIDWLKTLAISIRGIRSEMNIPPNKTIEVYLQSSDFKYTQQKFYQQQTALALLTKSNINLIAQGKEQEFNQVAITALAKEVKILVPLNDLIDKQTELARLNKELQKIAPEIERCQNKLNNQEYVAKAPEEIVKKEQLRLEELNIAFNKLSEQIELIQQLKE